MKKPPIDPTPDLFAGAESIVTFIHEPPKAPRFDSYVEPMEVAAEHAERVSEGWKEAALEAVRVWAWTHEHLLAEDVSPGAYAAGLKVPPSQRAWGSIMVRARKLGWIERDGAAYTTPTGTSNATWVTRWRSRIYRGG